MKVIKPTEYAAIRANIRIVLKKPDITPYEDSWNYNLLTDDDNEINKILLRGERLASVFVYGKQLFYSLDALQKINARANPIDMLIENINAWTAYFKHESCLVSLEVWNNATNCFEEKNGVHAWTYDKIKDVIAYVTDMFIDEHDSCKIDAIVDETGKFVDKDIAIVE